MTECFRNELLTDLSNARQYSGKSRSSLFRTIETPRCDVDTAAPYAFTASMAAFTMASLASDSEDVKLRSTARKTMSTN